MCACSSIREDALPSLDSFPSLLFVAFQHLIALGGWSGFTQRMVDSLIYDRSKVVFALKFVSDILVIIHPIMVSLVILTFYLTYISHFFFWGK